MLAGASTPAGSMSAKFDRRLIPERPSLEFEGRLRSQGFPTIAGIDEAGRGALAGPVSAAAVVLDLHRADLIEIYEEVRDSKELTERQRERLAALIRVTAHSWGVGFASASEIDRIGIASATRRAAGRALRKLEQRPSALLIDGIKLPGITLYQATLIKGDSRSLSIAAASILAKTARDRLLRNLDRRFPAYDFTRNKGYGTAAHLEAIQNAGPSSIHRKTFEPVRSWYLKHLQPQLV